MTAGRFEEAIVRFDAAHAEDPEKDASGQPKELVYARRMSEWLARLAPDASEALRLAIRCQHIRRWAIPRGAYPARAMSIARWQSLSPAHRAVLEEAIAVWEAALATQNRQALAEGQTLALKEGVVELPVSAEEQQHFEALYLDDARANAIDLARYGIEGKAVFDVARASVAAGGEIDCRENR